MASLGWRPQRATAIGFVLLALLALATTWMQARLDAYLLTLVSLVAINVMLATSLTLTNGFTGLFSLGHPAFMTIGGYLAAVLTFPARRKSMLADLPELLKAEEWELLPALLVGGVGASLAALLVGVPVLRLRGHYLAVATLGLIIIARVVVNNLEGYTRGALGLNGLPRLTNLWWAVGWAALTVFVAWRVKFSSLGRAMLAVRENELAARCMGIAAARLKIIAFVAGAFFAGVAGGLLAHLVTVITPGSYSIVLAFNLVVMVVVGGTGSITGAVVAAVGISIVSEGLRPLEREMELYGLSQILLAFALLLILIFRPRGLFGLNEPALMLPRKREGRSA